MRTKDHVVPKSQGGTKTVEACLRCNGAKADKSLEEFRALRGGIEFWGERAARLEAEKVSWIYEFDAVKKTVTPLDYERPVYEPTIDLSKIQHHPVAAKTKKERISVFTHIPPNLIGHKFGALTVIKWIVTAGRWEVLCMCGIKECRTTRAVRNPSNSFDACVECRRPLGKLRSDTYKATGVELSWEQCFQMVYGDYFVRKCTD